MKTKTLFYFILVTTASINFFITSLAFSEVEEKKSLIGFANHLFKNGHYYQAVTEYERFIYFNPDHPSIPTARLKIAYCYKLGEQYERALELFRNLVDDYRGLEVGIEAAYQVGECYSQSEDYELALIEFENFVADNPHHSLTEKAKWEMAWAHIYLENYSSASRQLLLVEEGSLYQNPSQELARALEELPHLPRKSPVVAGLLSAIIPGAGHLYMGKKKQAFSSFITNVILFFGSYEAFSKEIYAAGGLLSFFSINYYSGNIFGALNSAHKFNRKVRKKYLEGFREKYNISINLKGKKEGTMLELALTF